jgi:4'-phosphopantetheinyl transferase
MRLYYTHIDHWLSRGELSALIAPLPKKIQQDLLAYRRKEDATASFLGKCLVKHAFHHEGLDFSWDDVAYTEKDKPFLPGSPMQFNISHSGHYVAIIIGKGFAGVDVEQYREVKLELFNRQFSAAEWEQIHQATLPSRKFIEFWAIKEAAIKADGRGVAILSRTNILGASEVIADGQLMHYQLQNLDPGYACAICMDKTSSLFSRSSVNQDDLTGFFLHQRIK